MDTECSQLIARNTLRIAFLMKWQTASFLTISKFVTIATILLVSIRIICSWERTPIMWPIAFQREGKHAEVLTRSRN